MQIENTNTTEDNIKQMIYNHLKADIYQDQIQDLLEDITVFDVDLDYLREENNFLFNYVLGNPTLFMKSVETLLIDILKEEDMNMNELELSSKIRISFKGNLGQNTVTPRGLKASLLNKLIMLSGKVNHCSPVFTRLKKSVHYCNETDKFQ